MSGAFQMSRDVFDHPIWEDVPKFRIFFYLVGKAVFKEEGITISTVHIKRGQYLRSYRNIQEDLKYKENRAIKKYSLAVITRKIDQLVKENRLKIEVTELGTLFTVVNYASYQGLSNYTKETRNGVGTDLEQRWNRDGTELEQKEEGIKKDNNVLKDIVEIITHLNDAARTNYRPSSQKTQQLIKVRMNEGFHLDDFKKVIDIKTDEWLNDKGMSKYLRPETLFGTKFESYLNQNNACVKRESTYTPPDLFDPSVLLED